MTARLLPLTEVTERDRGAWQELAGRALEPNPFAEPAFVLPAARGLAALHAVALLVVEDRDGWQAAAPVRRVRRWRGIPLPLLVVWRHAYSYLGTPLVARTDALGPFLGALRAGAGGGLDWIGAGGPVRSAVDGGGELLRFASFERATLQRRPTGDYIALASKRRRELRRQRGKLAEQLGAECATDDRAGSAEAVEDFLALEASGWKGRRGTALTGHEDHAAFFREMCAGFAAQGRLQLLRWGTPERAVAMKCNLRAGDGIFCFKIAYDEDLGTYSPGIQLELENVRVFHDVETARWMDSCAEPDNDMINRLWPDRREIVTLLVPATGARGLLARPALAAAVRMRSKIKENT